MSPRPIVPVVLSALALAIAAVALATHGLSAPAIDAQRVSATTSSPLAWRGDWAPAEQYAPGDVVEHGGSSYVAAATSTGSEPAGGSADWSVMAAKGEQGDAGPAGPAGPAGKLDAGLPVAFLMPVVGAAKQNTTGHTILMSLKGAVVADPGENGHLYLEIAPNVANATWSRVAYVATRNAAGATGQIANGSTLTGVVRPGDWYRLTLVTASGYKTPDYVYDQGVGYFYPLD